MTAQRDALRKRRSRCCYSRIGMPKARYATAEEANSVALNHPPSEVYKCRVGEGYHVRSVRPI